MRSCRRTGDPPRGTLRHRWTRHRIQRVTRRIVSDAAEARLRGAWRLLRADPGLDFAPNARMEFLGGGRLRYSFDVGSNSQSVLLVYRVEGDVLLTDNPAAPHARETHFRFGPADVLILDFTGEIAWFVREL